MWRALLVGVSLALALPGCGDPGPRAALDTYLSRLSRPLDADVPSWAAVDPPPPPRSAELRVPVTAGRLDALDFLALRGCRLQATVGKRNSSLGRLAPPSQTLLLELEFLRLAPACVETLRADGRDALAITLENAAASKREALPLRIYNATLASEEFRAFWQGGAGPLAHYPKNTSSAPTLALDALLASSERWLAGDYRADNRQVEILLSEIATGDGGRLRRALALQGAALDVANGMLASRAPLCRGSLQPREADIVKNVVARFFVEGVQPWSAALGRRRHELLPPITRLEDLLAPVLPEAYRHWQTRRDAALTRAADAPRQHVEQVQATLEGCARDRNARSPLGQARLSTSGGTAA
jgi:hypothetical protein